VKSVAIFFPGDWIQQYLPALYFVAFYVMFGLGGVKYPNDTKYSIKLNKQEAQWNINIYCQYIIWEGT